MGLRDRLRLLVRGAPAAGSEPVRVSQPPKLVVAAPVVARATGWSGPHRVERVPTGATVVLADAFGRGASAPALLGTVVVTGTELEWTAAVAERLSASGHTVVYCIDGGA